MEEEEPEGTRGAGLDSAPEVQNENELKQNSHRSIAFRFRHGIVILNI